MNRRLLFWSASRASALDPERVTLGVAVFAGLLTLWNVATYPPGAGYDAVSHTQYADFLIHHLRLPVRNETAEYYSPPLYYGLVGGRCGARDALGLGVALGAAQMIRQFELYTLAVVALAWGAALWTRSAERRAVVRSGLVALAACVIIAGPWYVYRTVHFSNPV